MLDKNFIRYVINDILSTEEYSIKGIANYINTHEDVLNEMILGLNSDPSATLLRKTIELHRSLRSELYRAIIKKVINTYSTTSQIYINSPNHLNFNNSHF